MARLNFSNQRPPDDDDPFDREGLWAWMISAAGVIIAFALFAFVVILFAGCSVNRIAEGYSPDGNLLTRTWVSHQIGTVRQAKLSLEQVDGAYNINAGENVAVDPGTVEIIRLPTTATASVFGLNQLRRGDALAPVSMNQFDPMQGIGAQPINEQQQAILEARVQAEVEKARIKADNERLQEELAAAEAERDAARGALEEATRPREETGPQPSPNAPGVANREVTP